ncbi:ANKRD52 [Mytilus edulis]|uniref:ANKRD52 n=1 Tax=Mytilus edulis TaxID=6550 RepID=A0A8S3V3D3_MYTED|nr:ANKRD52 [Mytilus edulis]
MHQLIHWNTEIKTKNGTEVGTGTETAVWAPGIIHDGLWEGSFCVCCQGVLCFLRFDYLRNNRQEEMAEGGTTNTDNGLIHEDSSSDEDFANVLHKLDQFRATGGFDDFDASLINARKDDINAFRKKDQFGVPEGFEDFGCTSKYSDQSTDENSDNGTTLWDEIIDDSLKNADLIDEDGNNVLHKLVLMGDADNFDNFDCQINKLLFRKGKEFVKKALKQKNNIGNTPLLELLRCEDMECVNREALQIFLHEDYEYDINTSNNMKLGPLHLIMSKEFLPNIYENVSSTTDKQLLDDYNKKRNKIATMLLNTRANVNQKDIFDRTPLFLANATSSVQLLINNGADLNINDIFGRSILLAAVSMENH